MSSRYCGLFYNERKHRRDSIPSTLLQLVYEVNRMSQVGLNSKHVTTLGLVDKHGLLNYTRKSFQFTHFVDSTGRNVMGKELKGITLKKLTMVMLPREDTIQCCGDIVY